MDYFNRTWNENTNKRLKPNDKRNVKINTESIFLKSLFDAGMVCISDRFDIDGEFGSFVSLIELDIKTSFVEYTGLKTVYLNKKHYENKTKFRPYILNSLALFYKIIKEFKDIY